MTIAEIALEEELRAVLKFCRGPVGRFRGGLGIELELLRGEAVASVLADRTRQGPRGAQGGGDGCAAKFSSVCGGKRHEPPFRGKDQDVRLHPGAAFFPTLPASRRPQ